MAHYTVLLDLNSTYLPVKDVEPGNSISITQPLEGEELTIEESQTRLKYLAEKCPSKHFIIRDSEGNIIEPDIAE